MSFHSFIDDPDVAAEYCGYKGINIISSGLKFFTRFTTSSALGCQHLITIKHLYSEVLSSLLSFNSSAFDCSSVNFKIGDEPPSSWYIFLAVGALLLEINLAKGYLKKVGRSNIAGSLNKLNKNGSTFSNLSGPPKLKRITAFFISNFLLYLPNIQTYWDLFRAKLHALN